MKERVERICQWVVIILSCVILVLPLLVTESTLFPYVFSKIIFFRIAVELCAAAWLFLLLHDRRYLPNWRNPLVQSSIVFTGALVVTTLTSVDWQQSFFSDQGRMTGVLTWIHFLLWFLILTSTIREWKLWNVLLWISPLITLFVGYETFQNVKMISIAISPVGSPVSLGGYALLNVFISGLLLSREKNTLAQDFLIFLVFFNTILVFLSGSRGALFVLICSVVALCIFLYRSRVSQEARKKIQYILPIFFLVIASLFLCANLSFSRGWFSSPFLSPVRTVVTMFRLDGLPERGLVWLIGLEGFIEKPLTGGGWENFDRVYDRYFQPRLLGVSVPDFFLDRSYNQIIDVLSLAGIFGFLAYSFFWYAIFRSIYKAFQKEREESYRISLILLATFFVSYFLLGLTTSETPTNLIIFFFLLAFTKDVTNGIFTMATSSSNTGAFSHKAFAKEEGRLSPVLSVLYVCTATLLVFLIYFFNIRPFNESRSIQSAVLQVKINYSKSLSLFQAALSHKSFTNREARLYLIRSVSDYIRQESISKGTFRRAVTFVTAEIQKSGKDSHYSIQLYVHAAQFYRDIFFYDPSSFEQAFQMISSIQELSPKNIYAYYEFSELYAVVENYEKSVEWAEKAVVLDPMRGQSHFMLAVQYLRNKDFDRTFQEMEKAYSLRYLTGDNSGFIEILFTNFPPPTYHNSMIRYIDTVVAIKPLNLDYLIARVVIYSKVGDHKKASEYLKKLFTYDKNAALRAQALLKAL